MNSRFAISARKSKKQLKRKPESGGISFETT
jgi:hypothetical protein